MIQLNLVKTQLPSKIDIPRKKLKILKYGILPIVLVSIFLFILILAIVYYILISKVENRNNLTKKTAAISKQKAVKHKTVIKTKKISSLSKNEIKQNNEDKRLLKTFQNKKEAVFSIDIQLNDIPNKIVDNESDNSSDNQMALYQDIISKDEEKNVAVVKQKSPEQKIDTLHYVTLSTLNGRKLQRFLSANKIKYKVVKYKKSSISYYDIFVGGFNSYPALIKFSKALKKRGYNVYNIQNISLLYYVCIDKSVTKSKKNLYLKIWGKTPFKILTKVHFKNIYGYKFTFKTDLKTINKLKKLKFLPIIATIQNGA